MDELRIPPEESENPLENAEEEEESSTESESTLSSMDSSLEEFEEDDTFEDELLQFFDMARRFISNYAVGDAPTVDGILNLRYQPQPVVVHGHGDTGELIFISTQRPQIVRQEQIIVPSIIDTVPSTSSSSEDAESEESERPQLEENIDISGPTPTPESIEVVEEDLVYCSPLCVAAERLCKTIGTKIRRACQSVRRKLKKLFRRTAALSSEAPACSRCEQRREDSTADVSLREQVESESVEAPLTLKQRLRALRFPKFTILRKSTSVQPMSTSSTAPI